MKMSEPNTPSLHQLKKIVLPGYTPPKLVSVLILLYNQQFMYNSNNCACRPHTVLPHLKTLS